MSYIKNTWNLGDIIKKEKMNHIQRGIQTFYEGNTYRWKRINVMEQNGIFFLDKTWEQIKDMIDNQQIIPFLYQSPFLVDDGNNFVFKPIVNILKMYDQNLNKNLYKVSFFADKWQRYQDFVFVCQNENDYPQIEY